MATRFPRMPPSIIPEAPSGLRAAVAKHHISTYLSKKLTDNDKKNNTYTTLPPYPLTPHDESDDHHGIQGSYSGRVCIVGAGAAGLYTAMMLKWLGITDVEILEASDHVGGRCATHTFKDSHPCKHDYYDMGAMRIPDIDSMNSTKNLIRNKELLNMPEKLVEYVYRVSDDPSTKKPYEPTSYWNSNTKTPDGSKFDTAIVHVLQDLEISKLKYFIEGNDNLSTRNFLMQKAGLTYEQTMLGELSDTSTGLFDQALTETLCDYIDFQQASKKPWFRVEGGMSEVTNAMAAQVQSTSWPKVKRESPPVKISLSTPVVAMSISADRQGIDVSTTDAAGNALPTQQYDMVFSTTAMGPLQRMDLAGLNLPDKVITGIRALSYDRATKVAIKFKTRWWKGFYRSPDQWGGVSQSDLPISNVVYPSWDDGEDSPAVLIVSYTWAQDATRMASLVPDYSKTAPQRSDPIVALCLRELVKLWASQPDAPTFDQLWDDYLAHHAWAWSHDPYTGGAFALFGPGQFGHLYPRFLRNFCKNKFAMSGEALSAHHAWISGALDSAYGSVMRWLLGRGMGRKAWHLFMSPFGGGKGKHAAEFDDEILRWGADLSCRTEDSDGEEEDDLK